MKFLKLISLAAFLSSLIFTQSVQAAAYEDDSQNFYVDGQSLNDALATVNEIICYMSAMRPDAFVNDGAYRATIYEEDCATSTADATSESSSATATSSSSSSTASAATAGTVAAKTASKALLSVTRADNVSPVLGKAWVESASDDQYSPDVLVYVDIAQTAGPSVTAPNGNFEMKFSAHADLSTDVEGVFSQFGIEDGQIFSQGYILAQDDVLKYKELGGGAENNVAATFLPSGDKYGVYGEDASYNTFDFAAAEQSGDFSGLDDPDNYVNITGYYRFYMSAADKGYCQKLFIAETVVWPDTSLLPENPGEDFDWGAFWEPTRTEVYNAASGLDNLADYAKSGLATTEECFSTDRKKAQRNVHRYGVYNDDGSRLAIANPGFPLRATVQSSGANGETFPIEVHAYADYWGVHVDPIGRALIDDTTVFRKETFNENDTVAADEANYNLVASDIKIERRQTSYLPLNDLDGLNFAMHIDDPWWSTEYIALFGGTPAFKEYEGSFDKETKTFTLTKGLEFQPEYKQTELSTPVTFTIAQWQAAMKKTYGAVGDEWYFEDIKSLGVWSHDTRQWYDILPSGMANPEVGSAPLGDTAGVGMRTESTDYILPADLTETLYCLRECLTGTNIRQTMGEALQLIAAETTSGTVTSPYADVGEYLKTDVDSVAISQGLSSLSEATDGFATVAAATAFQLGSGGIAVTDYINGNISLPHYMRGSSNGVSEGALALSLDGGYSAAGLSRTNLNKLLGGGTGGSGIAPELRLDLISIPSSGSGTLKMTVTVLEGSDATYTVGEEALSAVATLNWASNGATFTAILPSTETATLSLTLEDGTTVQANRSIAADQTIISATVEGIASTPWKVFNLISGSSDLSALNTAGLKEFFEEGQNYTVEVKIEDTTLAIQGPDSTTLTSATLGFSVVEDANVTNSQTYVAGTRFDGIQASEMLTYSYDASSGKIVDTEGVSLEKGADVSKALLSIENPEELLQQIVYNNPEGWQQSVAWGLRTGQLIAASDLTNMECRKNGKDKLYDDHPVYGNSTDVKRYCSYQQWNGAVQTTYTFSVEARPSYAIQSASTGLPIDIDEPKTLYYQVPETLDPATGEFTFGKDAGKRIRLEFRGHGDLGGIPGFVYDTKNDVEIGEFVNEWKEGYRYISRFTIPDGAILEDALDSTKTYKVKALEGEEWLTKADGTVAGLDFRNKYTYLGSKSDLATVDDMSTPGDPLNEEDYIGAVPTVLINEGETSVIHGEIVFDPTPQ
ncbi:hypothetical protein OAB62_05615 [Pseudomonadales bacterium]|nr:hypothetical protein [Pseudomonadales bacterium]